jgi:hypothetical protein
MIKGSRLEFTTDILIFISIVLSVVILNIQISRIGSSVEDFSGDLKCCLDNSPDFEEDLISSKVCSDALADEKLNIETYE